MQAIAGAGFDWKFSEVAVLGAGLSGFLIRSMSVVVSIGGMLITALLLGIVSGKHLCGLKDLPHLLPLQGMAQNLISYWGQHRDVPHAPHIG